MPSEIDLFLEYIKTQEEDVIGHPATEQEIAEFEARHGVNLPADVREYFLKINGINPEGSFITLEALNKWVLMVESGFTIPEYIIEQLGDADKYFRFGGYDISVWDWFIRLDSDSVTEPSVVVLFQYHKAKKIASSFSEFLQKYRIDDPISLLC